MAAQLNTVKERERLHAKQVAELPEKKTEIPGAGDDTISVREFLTSCLHRNVFELFFNLISTTVASCPFLSERQTQERVLKELLVEADQFPRSGFWQVMGAPDSVHRNFEHSGQEAIIKKILTYLASAGPNDMVATNKLDFSKLRALKDDVAKSDQRCTARGLRDSWCMTVPTRDKRHHIQVDPG